MRTNKLRHSTLENPQYSYNFVLQAAVCWLELVAIASVQDGSSQKQIPSRKYPVPIILSGQRFYTCTPAISQPNTSARHNSTPSITTTLQHLRPIWRLWPWSDIFIPQNDLLFSRDQYLHHQVPACSLSTCLGRSHMCAEIASG